MVSVRPLFFLSYKFRAWPLSGPKVSPLRDFKILSVLSFPIPLSLCKQHFSNALFSILIEALLGFGFLLVSS